MPPFFRLTVPFILASQSPRRRDLLEHVKASFRVKVSPVDERLDSNPPPRERAQQLAIKKAIPVAGAHPSALVLAADTIVAHEDTVLNKPATREEARSMLHRLSNTTHDVHTGIALRHNASNRTVSSTTTTIVTFAPLSSQEVDAYVATGSPLDKAGGYGIQDHVAPFFIERVEGDYYNVVGLPLRRLYQTLKQDFSDLLDTTPSSD